MLKSDSVHYEENSFRVINQKYMTEKKGENKGAPRRTFTRSNKYLGGYSDHFPVGAFFNN